MLFNKIKRTHFAPFQFTRFCTSCGTYFSRFGPCNYNKLLSNYFKSGFIREAEDLLDEIPERDVVSWSTLIHGYAINGFHRKSLESFSQMRFAGLFFNSFTMVGVLVGTAGLRNLELAKSVHGLIVKCGLESNLRVSTAMFNTVCEVVRSCVALGARTLCESIHGLVVKLGLILDITVNNSLLDVYSSLMDLDTANKIFKEMECKDIISWTIMMGLLIDLQNACEALNIFCKMRKSGIICDSVVVINLISACAILGDLKRGRQIHAQAVVCGFESELHLANSIIAMYSKCGDLDASRAVFNQTTAKSLVSWTAMISGCVQNGCAIEALNLLIKARKEKKYCMDSIMLVSALTACGELVALEICQQLHCYSFQVGFPQYRPVQNSLISTYSKCGNVDLAYVVFKEMGFLQDVVSWNAIISGHGINGQGETALTLYRKMRKCGENPDSATYSCILSSCSHAGLIDDGLVIFKQLVEENKVSPSREHYGCIIDLLARAGRLSDASWIAGKISKGMGTDFWRALLNGCVLHGNVELAELVATKVFELDPEESDQAVLLSNVYASVGRFQDAAALRSSMQKKGLIKNPGISFLNSSSCITEYETYHLALMITESISFHDGTNHNRVPQIAKAEDNDDGITGWKTDRSTRTKAGLKLQNHNRGPQTAKAEDIDDVATIAPKSSYSTKPFQPITCISQLPFNLPSLSLSTCFTVASPFESKCLFICSQRVPKRLRKLQLIKPAMSNPTVVTKCRIHGNM
ncbi:hypothetical protein Dsin_025457 [Dipteronia sinensis]|uniref:Pentatricopeptide repeat-containing protein n=1 Tax=Dipteronia sinensis TaxID=43782 RepID=A0AAE0DWZ5_9ROSI|nr:hypothetical protein Dsin_025457 [Dipteronia sinensis]